MESQQLKNLILNELSNIAPEVDSDDVPDTEDLRDALELDSMDFLNLIIAVAKRTQVTIPETDYRKVLTLSNLINYLLNKENQ